MLDNTVDQVLTHVNPCSEQCPDKFFSFLLRILERAIPSEKMNLADGCVLVDLWKSVNQIALHSRDKNVFVDRLDNLLQRFKLDPDVSQSMFGHFNLIIRRVAFVQVFHGQETLRPTRLLE